MNAQSLTNNTIIAIEVDCAMNNRIDFEINVWKKQLKVLQN